MFGFSPSAVSAAPQQAQQPWAGLPIAQQPWNPQGAAPWRLGAWQTQGMPSGVPAAPYQGFGFGGMMPQINPQAYLPVGQTGSIPGFNPLVAGGGVTPSTVSPVSTPQPAGPAVPQGASYRMLRPQGPDMDYLAEQGGYGSLPRMGWAARDPFTNQWRGVNRLNAMWGDWG